jgi:predicted RNA binding protein YcfA (HicA-like mRNA interferase family)
LPKTVREIISALQADGWREVASRGGHRQFKHPLKPGRVTVPFHRGDVSIKVVRSVERQAGLKLEG